MKGTLEFWRRIILSADLFYHEPDVTLEFAEGPAHPGHVPEDANGGCPWVVITWEVREVDDGARLVNRLVYPLPTGPIAGDHGAHRFLLGLLVGNVEHELREHYTVQLEDGTKVRPFDPHRPVPR